MQLQLKKALILQDFSDLPYLASQAIWIQSIIRENEAKRGAKFQRGHTMISIVEDLLEYEEEEVDVTEEY